MLNFFLNYFRCQPTDVEMVESYADLVASFEAQLQSKERILKYITEKALKLEFENARLKDTVDKLQAKEETSDGTNDTELPEDHSRSGRGHNPDDISTREYTDSLQTQGESLENSTEIDARGLTEL